MACNILNNNKVMILTIAKIIVKTRIKTAKVTTLVRKETSIE